MKDLYNGWNSKISRAKAQRVIRTRKIKENLGGKADAFVYLLTIIHDRYKDYVEQNKKQEIFSTFLFEVSFNFCKHFMSIPLQMLVQT